MSVSPHDGYEIEQEINIDVRPAESTAADGWPEPLPLETFGPLPAPTRLRPPVAD